jgi:outer membrane protein TolC
MKNKIQLMLLTGAIGALTVLSSQKTAFSQEKTNQTQLSDGPQTLPAADAAESDATDAPDESTAPKTEVIPAAPAAPAETAVETLEEPPAETAPAKAEPARKKSPVLSEEELLKPAKKTESKIKSKPATESEMYIAEADKYKLNETFKNLALNDVIEQGLRKNYEQNIRAQRNEVNEIQFQGAKSAFWMPDLKINLTTTPQRISTLHRSSRTPTTVTPTTPTGTLGLSLGDYTVFNWGKDYALYLNTKSVYERTKQIYDESKRELKLDLIGSFFSLMTSKNVERIRQDQLRQASFVYRLNKEKITIGKTTKQDYYQARSEYLRAQNDFHEAKIQSDLADENMSYLIADDVGTKYILNETMDYKRIKIPLDDALNLAVQRNPTLLNNKTSVDVAEREYDVALKENMPLPKFSVNLGAYNKRFGPTTNSTVYETYGGSGNIELVAAVNATWALTGEDGLFNTNKLAISRMGKEIAFKELDKNRHFTQSYVRQTYQNILSLQNQVLILEARIPTLQKSFDTILENYLSGKTKYNDFHLALEELTTTKVLYEQTRLSHLKEKLNLAKLSGMEDFPGENFEQLATRVKGK